MSEASDILKIKIPEIMDIWEKRTLAEVKSAYNQNSLKLRDSLPKFLALISDSLTGEYDRVSARKKRNKEEEKTKAAKEHGEERADSANYTIDQLIFEYQILRQVIFDELEKEIRLTPIEVEIILCSIEQAVNDAATKFSEMLIKKNEDFNQVNKLSEQRSKELKSRDEFISIASHELKTPIAAIILQLELVLRNLNQGKDYALEPDALKKVVALTIKQSRNLAKLGDDLLSVSMIQLGRLQMNLESGIDIGLLIKTAIDRVNSEQRYVITLKLPLTPVRGEIDRSRIEQVVTNLVSNAIKYGENKPIEVELIAKDAGWCEIRIKDQGPGIQVADQERIFKRFKRAGPDIGISGLGLGLYISQQILNAHRGGIRVESAPGQGSTFIVKIPLSKDVA